jgi:hypothetical protein
VSFEITEVLIRIRRHSIRVIRLSPLLWSRLPSLALGVPVETPGSRRRDHMPVEL